MEKRCSSPTCWIQIITVWFESLIGQDVSPSVIPNRRGNQLTLKFVKSFRRGRNSAAMFTGRKLQLFFLIHQTNFFYKFINGIIWKFSKILNQLVFSGFSVLYEIFSGLYFFLKFFFGCVKKKVRIWRQNGFQGGLYSVSTKLREKIKQNFRFVQR